MDPPCEAAELRTTIVSAFPAGSRDRRTRRLKERNTQIPPYAKDNLRSFSMCRPFYLLILPLPGFGIPLVALHAETVLDAVTRPDGRERSSDHFRRVRAAAFRRPCCQAALQHVSSPPDARVFSPLGRRCPCPPAGVYLPVAYKPTQDSVPLPQTVAGSFSHKRPSLIALIPKGPARRPSRIERMV